MQVLLPLLDDPILCERQEVADNAVRSIKRLDNNAEVFLLPLRTALAEQLHEAPDDSHRIADLMRDARRHLADEAEPFDAMNLILQAGNFGDIMRNNGRPDHF